MPRKKKDGRFINYYIDRTIYERLEHYADDRSLTMTTALEQILEDYLSRYERETALTERYCSNCHILVKAARCPVCGKRWLDVPRPEDYCFLTERPYVWAGLLEDALRQNEIPYLTENTMGAGLTSKIGNMLESVRFYVPYACLGQAEALMEELFTAKPQEPEEKES